MSCFWKKQAMLRPGKQVVQLKRLVETRWACQHMSIVTIRQTYGAILATLNAIASSTDHDRSIKPKEFYVTFKFSVSYTGTQSEPNKSIMVIIIDLPKNYAWARFHICRNSITQP